MKTGIPKGRKCNIYKYEILPTSYQKEQLLKMLGPFKKGNRSFILRSDDSFTLNELELRIKNVDDPIEVLWTRFRPDIVNTLTISQEYTGRYYVLFKRDARLENRLNAYPKPPRSRQDGIGRAGIHYHPK